jgi:integrase/recombinase XerD
MKTSGIEISGEKRIKIEFPFDKGIVSLIKQIGGARWSPAMKAWHLPYSGAAFEQLKKIFPEIEYPANGTVVTDHSPVAITTANTTADMSNVQERENKNVSIQVIGRTIILKLPKNPADTRFITSMRYSRWDGKQFCWIVPNWPGNLDLLKDYFHDRIFELIIHEDFEVKTGADAQRSIRNDELLILKTNAGRLRLIFAYNKGLAFMIKKMPFSNWDKKNKWWTIPLF